MVAVPVFSRKSIVVLSHATVRTDPALRNADRNIPTPTERRAR